jgi:RNA polymerase sigma-70 factor, ECF subfamily
MTELRRQFDRALQPLIPELYRFAVFLSKSDALAQDVVQETCLRAWKSWAELRDVQALKAWLYTIVRREYARTFERKRLDVSDLETAVNVQSGDHSQERQSELHEIRTAMSNLEPKYREPLLMQVLGGFSGAEIAHALGETEAAITTQLFRARQQLKAKLETPIKAGNVYAIR